MRSSSTPTRTERTPPRPGAPSPVQAPLPGTGIVPRAKSLSVLALSAALSAGCISYSNFQMPDVLDEGDALIGVGATAVAADQFGLLPEVYARYGFSDRVDAGAKIAGIPPFGLLFGDVKYQLVDGPVAVAADLGISYAGGSADIPFDDDESEEDYSFVGLYPAIMVGTDRLYGGAKAIYIAGGTADTEWISGDVFGLFAGTSFGDRVRLLPEVHAYFGDDVAVLGGIAFEFGMGGGP